MSAFIPTFFPVRKLSPVVIKELAQGYGVY